LSLDVSVGLVSGRDASDHLVPAEDEGGPECEALLAGLVVLEVEIRAAQELIIIHGSPRMVGFLRHGHIADARQEVEPEVLLGEVAVYLALGVVLLLADVHCGKLCVRLDLHVRIHDAIVYNTLIPMNYRIEWHPHANDRLSLVVDGFDVKRRRGVERLRIVDPVDDVALDVQRVLLVHADHGAIVLHAEKDVASLAVGKRADGLECVVLGHVATPFELDGDALAALEHVNQVCLVHCLSLPTSF